MNTHTEITKERTNWQNAERNKETPREKWLPIERTHERTNERTKEITNDRNT